MLLRVLYYGADKRETLNGRLLRGPKCCERGRWSYVLFSSKFARRASIATRTYTLVSLRCPWLCDIFFSPRVFSDALTDDKSRIFGNAFPVLRSLPCKRIGSRLLYCRVCCDHVVFDRLLFSGAYNNSCTVVTIILIPFICCEIFVWLHNIRLVILSNFMFF